MRTRFAILLLVTGFLGASCGGYSFRAPKAPEVPPPQVEAPPPDARSAKEHVVEALRLLDAGEPERARAEAQAALALEPANDTAKMLLSHIDGDPQALLGEESFPYVVQSGDSLSKLAKRFLGDEHKFYLLSRYNGIAKPGDLAAGQTIRIPGKRPEPAPRPPPAPREEPPAAPREPPAAPKEPAPQPAKGAEADAERAYQSGLKELKASAPDKAYESFAQAVRLNPKHAKAREKALQTRPAAVDAYYRKAVAALRRHELDETILYCNKALELEPENEKVKLRRAEAIELQERVKKLQ